MLNPGLVVSVLDKNNFIGLCNKCNKAKESIISDNYFIMEIKYNTPYGI